MFRRFCAALGMNPAYLGQVEHDLLDWEKLGDAAVNRHDEICDCPKRRVRESPVEAAYWLLNLSKPLSFNKEIMQYFA